MAYEFPKVSKHFNYDWQFAVDASKVPLLRPASLVIGFMPLLTKTSKLFGTSAPLSWLTWYASVAFIISWAILWIRCPYLLRHYRHYGAFAAEKHSHRWIVWLFYLRIENAPNWQDVIRETLPKGVCLRASDSISADVYRACPYLVKKPDGQFIAFGAPTDVTNVQMFYPVNQGRDLCIPIHCDGERRVLLLQEDDPELEQKQRELFWIHYTAVTKANPKSRFAFWSFFYLSVALLAINVVWNVLLALWR